MRRNSSRRNRKNSYYNVALLRDELEKVGLTVHGIAIRLRMNRDTVRLVFKGTGTYKHVWPIADFLGIEWAKLHDLPPKQNGFDRAALKLGDSRSVRRADVRVGTSARSV